MIPGGKADQETDMQVAAQRELREETGFAAGKLTSYGSTNLSDSVSITNHFFLASDLTSSPLPKDPGEWMTVEEYSIPDAIEKVLTSPRVHAPSAVALLKYAREHGL